MSCIHYQDKKHNNNTSEKTGSQEAVQGCRANVIYFKEVGIYDLLGPLNTSLGFTMMFFTRKAGSMKG